MSEEEIIFYADDDQLTPEEKMEFLQALYMDAIEAEELNKELNLLNEKHE